MKEEKFVAGYYVSDIRMNIVRRMNTASVKNSNGSAVERVYGTWAMDESLMIKFEPGKKVMLDKEDIKLPNVRTLIESGHLKRTL